MDPCECICDPIFRLLRQLQANSEYCTDADCLRELPDGQSDAYTQLTTTIGIAAAWVAVAGVLYYMRPNSMRRRQELAGKPQSAQQNRPNDRNDDGGGVQ